METTTDNLPLTDPNKVWKLELNTDDKSLRLKGHNVEDPNNPVYVLLGNSVGKWNNNFKPEKYDRLAPVATIADVQARVGGVAPQRIQNEAIPIANPSTLVLDPFVSIYWYSHLTNGAMQLLLDDTTNFKEPSDTTRAGERQYDGCRPVLTWEIMITTGPTAPGALLWDSRLIWIDGAPPALRQNKCYMVAMRRVWVGAKYIYMANLSIDVNI